jgi:MFS family permease
MVPASVGLVAVLLFVFTFDDRRLDPSHPLPPYRLGEFLRSFWVNPRRYPDYAWAWYSRLFLNWGYATALSYQVLFLTDKLGVAQASVAGLVFISSSILQATAVVFSGLGGWVSDRLGRRKIIVVIAAVLLASGLSVAAFSTSFTMFLVGVTIAGIGQGFYVAVELAIVAGVITSDANAARDFGVSNIANTLPQTLVPTLAPLILAVPLFGATDGNNYTALFLFGAVLTLLGALAIQPAKKLH